MNDRAHVLCRPRRAWPPIARQQFGVSTSRLQAAQRTCQHLHPATGGSLDASSLRQYELTGDCPQVLVRQAMTEMLKFARCMRSHGVPNFPDPTNGGSGAPFFPISNAGISEAASRTPHFVHELSECARLVGDNAPESFG